MTGFYHRIDWEKSPSTSKVFRNLVIYSQGASEVHFNRFKTIAQVQNQWLLKDYSDAIIINYKIAVLWMYNSTKLHPNHKGTTLFDFYSLSSINCKNTIFLAMNAENPSKKFRIYSYSIYKCVYILPGNFILKAEILSTDITIILGIFLPHFAF